MMKMLIVDDEPIITQGLKLTVPWEEYDIEVVDEAADGEEALEKLAQNDQIELVLSDVRMPNMDGIEFAEALVELTPRPKVIMLSGYDEFDYAKQALRTGVKDYLLKPVDVDELLNTVQRVKWEIENEKKTHEQMRKFKIQEWVNQYIMGTVSADQTEQEDVEVFPIISSLKHYVETVQAKSEQELYDFRKSWQENTDKLLSKEQGWKSLSRFYDENILFTIIYDWKERPNPDEVKKVFEKKTGAGWLCHYIIPNETTVISNVKPLYKTLSEGLKAAVNRSESFYILGKDVLPSSTRKKLTLPDSFEEKLLNALNKDMKDLIQALDLLFSYIEKHEYTLNECIDLFRELEIKIGDHHNKVMRFDKYMALDLAFLKRVNLFVFNSYGSLRVLLEQDLSKIYEALNPDDRENHHWLIDRAIKYIDQYYNVDIKASEIANYINISPNYFSVLFKQNTGMNFNEYLNKLRIEKAKFLLEKTAEKVVDISAKVGYQNYKYFFQIFKQITNMTPTEYRKFVS